MKRQYREVAVIRDELGGYGVALDGRALVTPAGRALGIPTRALAEAIAEEWSAQGERVAPATMPLMQLMATTLDRVAPGRADAVAQLIRYGETDLLCYRATEPPDLVSRQAAMWQPLVDWAALRYGAALAVTHGLMPRPQPDAALAALRAALEQFDAPVLAGLLAATAAAGSLILALALHERRLSAEEAWALSLLDETFQIEQWGEDAEAARRRAALRADLIAAGRFLVLATRAE
jgi:chaperone required for assembly of F1-ATPase